jgi:cytochrome d ubiquinol oxidase subunit I
VGFYQTPDGAFHLSSFWALMLNPWAWWQYAHNMSGAVITGAFVMSAVGAYYLLNRKHVEQGRIFVRVGVVAAVVFSLLQAFPTGDSQGKMVAHQQPVTLAAMEALFQTDTGAHLVIIGQPDVENMKLDNPISIPGLLSFLTYKRWNAEVKGLEDFPRETWPDNIALLYYSYHIMVGLGTIFIAVALLSAYKLKRGTLYRSKPMLWVLMLAFPFPYIANTAGWITAEVGRQPWLVYGLMRTAHGFSPRVSAGNGIFTLLGFMGMYTVLSMLFLFLVWREIERGPEPAPVAAPTPVEEHELELVGR